MQCRGLAALTILSFVDWFHFLKMRYCSAQNCKNKSTNGIRLFRFPRDKVRRAKWVHNCGRKNWQPTENNALCEHHFEESQYELKRADGRKLLKWNSIPTIFNVPKYHQEILTFKEDSNEASPNDFDERVVECEQNTLEDENVGFLQKPTILKHTQKSTPEAPMQKTLPVKKRKIDHSNEFDVRDIKSEQNILEDETVGPSQNHIQDHCYIKGSIRDHTQTSILTTITQQTSKQITSPAERNNIEDSIEIRPYEFEERDFECEPNTLEVENVESSQKLTSQKMLQLKMKNKKLKKQIRQLTAKQESMEKNLKSFLNPDQIEFLKRLSTTNPYKWTDETICHALKVKSAVGNKGYDFLLQSSYPLPSRRTLSRRIEGAQFVIIMDHKT
ncbi:THAP domain-containing protein 5 [Nilaparvata lugens]|uniref:THAP domain-containing protein 5 n=1 Tax=Nilaparvata lugens TaxID=108931 RepID=UPI00193CAFCD|nr:THAP domain-containing protein 5 [Nilaparvata lugens]